MPVLLRPWSLDDAAALQDAVATSPDLERQLGPSTPATESESRDFIARRLAPSRERVNAAIVVDGRAVGNVGISSLDRVNDIGWVYYWLGTDARGRGLAARAAATIAAHGFGELGLFRLELGHRVNNPASCGFATRAGFLAEGVERQKLRYGSERFDTETHARLATDPAPDVDLLALSGF
ncbi:GNAT family N-acetyltransferase [Microbacterium sp. NEAU-LLC]|uniref:GNAT family N-acetyltransferase n=1 Tax=Microbacterium helvum TaxID=2773713 RepID=A0ABR8NQ23_9MICO|nr:GNAT family protein [Microbacterium helvum]MBD3942745.1 GNAT family N-acetyltransferase [Microbacterium helvum]